MTLHFCESVQTIQFATDGGAFCADILNRANDVIAPYILLLTTSESSKLMRERGWEFEDLSRFAPTIE